MRDTVSVFSLEQSSNIPGSNTIISQPPNTKRGKNSLNLAIVSGTSVKHFLVISVIPILLISNRYRIICYPVKKEKLGQKPRDFNAKCISQWKQSWLLTFIWTFADKAYISNQPQNPPPNSFLAFIFRYCKGFNESLCSGIIWQKLFSG